MTIEGRGCHNCFYWTPEPWDLGPTETAFCISEGDYTAAAHYCDFWQERKQPEPPPLRTAL